MADIIRLLPESVANQIAAGEVVQRPASALKELMENALDAGARVIHVYLKDAGKTYIRVMDDGSGMSASDAAAAFQRHATSKIRETDDLYGLHSFGFRGEALASIAAISEVILRTRRQEDELGVELHASASGTTPPEQVMCPVGSDFMVKNLFYNVPARRRFLKSDATELNHCVQEFRKIALACPGVHFTLHHNKTEVYQLPPSNIRQRIGYLFGKHLNPHLVTVSTTTSIVTISGFITKPSCARRSPGDQYFFANGRFIRHSMLHKAVVQAYAGLIPAEAIPVYYLFLEVPPETLDVNIHPSKTEVKFQDEQSVFQILKAAAREALGKFSIVPSIDFNQDGAPEIPVLRPDTRIHNPETFMDPDYNPFVEEPFHDETAEPMMPAFPTYPGKLPGTSSAPPPDASPGMFSGRVTEPIPEPVPDSLQNSLQDTSSVAAGFLQLKGMYIVTPVKSGMMLIDQKRAHERILYEQFLGRHPLAGHGSQQLLFPRQVELSHDDARLFDQLADAFRGMGFDFTREGAAQLTLTGEPGYLELCNPAEMLVRLLDDYRNLGEEAITEDGSPEIPGRDHLAAAMARNAAVSYNQMLSNKEMQYITEQLLSCAIPHLSPDGKKTIHLVTLEQLRQLFQDSLPEMI